MVTIPTRPLGFNQLVGVLSFEKFINDDINFLAVYDISVLEKNAHFPLKEDRY